MNTQIYVVSFLLQSSNCKTTVTHNNFRHCRVCFYAFVRQPFSKQLYGLFSAILEKNTIKTPEVIFHIGLRALQLSASLILKNYLYASFSFSF